MLPTPLPVLETERTLLRLPEARDAEAVIAFLLDKDRAEGFGAAENRGEAWRWFALNIGHWHLHGYGYFTVEMKDSGEPAGLVGIWNPEGWPEPELGWVMFAGFEGKGLAYEAALAARDWAYAVLDFETLTSNIVPGNTRSVALAERLGATYERTYQNVHMGEDMLFRHPGPDALDADGSVEAYA
ncbi:GNAT family N-acetyltransferase [Shimia biformata]|uniref:GNAT family N-acetyltransferase n=1 Tax=Shimia biformata TaxID=1294299 RepID=UPI003B833B92